MEKQSVYSVNRILWRFVVDCRIFANKTLGTFSIISVAALLCDYTKINHNIVRGFSGPRYNTEYSVRNRISDFFSYKLLGFDSVLSRVPVTRFPG